MAKKKPKAVKATAEQPTVDEALASLTPAAMVCRDISHNWDPEDASHVPGGYERTFECRTCTTKRTEVLNNWGEVIKRKPYKYPDGYLLKNIGRFSGAYKDRLRLANAMEMVKQRVAAREAVAQKLAEENVKGRVRPPRKPKPAAAAAPAKKTTAKPAAKKTTAATTGAKKATTKKAAPKKTTAKAATTRTRKSA